MDDLTFDILKIVLSVCVALISVYLIPYIKTLKSDKRYEQLIYMVEVAVRAAEQTVKGSGMGEKKKSEVISYVIRYMDRIGIKITAEQLDRLIECAVYQMKRES